MDISALATKTPRAEVIVGRGIEGYYWAIRHLVSRGSWPVTTYRYEDHEDGIGDLRLPRGDAPRIRSS